MVRVAARGTSLIENLKGESMAYAANPIAQRLSRHDEILRDPPRFYYLNPDLAEQILAGKRHQAYAAEYAAAERGLAKAKAEGKY